MTGAMPATPRASAMLPDNGFILNVLLFNVRALCGLLIRVRPVDLRLIVLCWFYDFSTIGMEALTYVIKKNATVAVIVAITKRKWKRLQIKI
jgi:hypothetical protein